MSVLSQFKAFCREHAPVLTRIWRAWLASRWVEAWRDLPARTTLYDGSVYKLTKGLRSDLAVWRTFDFDEEARAIFSSYQGGDIIDIGASHGAYSLILAPKAAAGDRHLMLEPNSAAFPVLLKNLSALARVFPHIEFLALNLPAGDGQGTEVTYPMGTARGMHPCFAPRPLRPGERGSIVVDDLVAALHLRPKLIKVDVEGAEFSVLRGLERTLKEKQPTLLIEVHPDWLPPGISVRDIENLLTQCGYEAGRQLTDRHRFWVAKPSQAVPA